MLSRSIVHKKMIQNLFFCFVDIIASADSWIRVTYLHWSSTECTGAVTCPVQSRPSKFDTLIMVNPNFKT